MELNGTRWCMVEFQWGLSQAFQFIHIFTKNSLHSTKVELGHFQWKFGGMFGGLGTGSRVVYLLIFLKSVLVASLRGDMLKDHLYLQPKCTYAFISKMKK
jgi:hypothetical protein